MRFPHSVFRRGASMSVQLCLLYQHYWLQVMFWTESIWPLEGLKYIIVQRETSWDCVCASNRHTDRVATKKSAGHMDKHFSLLLRALQNLKIQPQDGCWMEVCLEFTCFQPLEGDKKSLEVASSCLCHILSLYIQTILPASCHNHVICSSRRLAVNSNWRY